MRVKRLELQGFKSFKDKTVVHFDEGITGIVGPNGCGKSNIVDSFFWVMGEQSIKHMRADGSLDLIFNGSEKYTASSFAEVTIILSTGVDANQEVDGVEARDLPPHLRYHEISVTRRLYRDSTSEYLINGQTCRLRDIHELFMDTGAGPKAYSIIEQGQISRIVASKAEDRRVLIEEAAGVTKFKARKKESLRKIEAARQNLLRLNDIISEIERQLNFLERQAAKARQYKKFREDLTSKEMLVGRKKLHGLREKVESIRQRLSTLEITEVESRNNLQTAELQIENLKLQLTNAQRSAEEVQLHLQGLQRGVSENETKIALQKRQIQEIENSNTTLEEENETLAQRLTNLTSEREFLEKERDDLQKLFENADEILRDQQIMFEEAKAQADTMSQELEREKRELMSSLSRQTEFSNQVHGLEARVDSLSVQLNSVGSRISDRELDRDVLLEKEAVAKEAYEKSSSELGELRTRTDFLKVETQSLETELKTLRVDESNARQERTKTDSKIKTLQQLVENHEGFRADVRNILRSEHFAPALRGVFADSLEAHPGYEYALEGVMREFLENLFVEKGDEAASLVEKLKEQSLGRAAFWALDLLKIRDEARGRSGFAKIEDEKIRSLVGGSRPLREVIRLNHDASASVLALFDHYYVVDTIEEALFGFKATAEFGVSFVTRQGDMVDRYGRVMGGSTSSLEGGILARKAELQRLTEQLGQLAETSERLTARLAEVEATLIVKRSELEQCSSRLREVEVLAKSSERDLASAEMQLVKVREELERFITERDGMDVERKSLWEKLDGIRKELSGIEGSTREREAFIDEKSRVHNELSQKAAELQGTLVQMKVDFAAAQEKYKHAKINLDRIETDFAQARNRKEEVERLMNRKLDEKDFLAQELQVFEDQLHEQLSVFQNSEATLRERKDAYERVNAQLTQAFDDQRRFMKAVEESSIELNQIKIDQEKSSLEFQMLYQNLFEKYGLEESKVGPQNEEEEKLFAELDSNAEVELQAEVDRLREKIRKLGEVNLSAVEEYDEQKKRHEFLTTQRDDLLRSIQDLEKAIQRINKTSEERFLIAFNEVNERFQRVFPLVFGGGWGRLEMTNPADLNETGIDIIAEPPGKKMASIQLLSGGEKALTAVALIFSIFLIKPSPFCVLDEVDAPLDDHNVGKFNSLLKEMARRSQFIVITHNKRTMELNDKLYGVTMEEPGVSKMVSIQIQ